MGETTNTTLTKEKEDFIENILKKYHTQSVDGVWSIIKKDNKHSIKLKEVKEFLSTITHKSK